MQVLVRGDAVWQAGRQAGDRVVADPEINDEPTQRRIVEPPERAPQLADRRFGP